MVAQITTRSGLGAGRVFGNIDGNHGSFGTVGGSVGLGFGSQKLGKFFAVDGLRSGRFLDTAELTKIALLTINPYVRKDQFNYYASRDPFADTPATQSQNR